jgi:GNAT superfamily N-acetyltransferase
MPVSFETMTGRAHVPQVLRMMRELYETDAPELAVDPEKFPHTIDALLDNPARGRVVLFFEEDIVVGYSLLIPYWSNEFAGTVVIVDELLVEQRFRGQGIASAFFRYLERERPFDAVMLALEVSPKNARARGLYESMGFEERSLRTMMRRL